MPRPFTDEVCQQVVNTIERDGLTPSEAHKIFGVSRNAVREMLRRFRIDGCPTSALATPGSRSKVDLAAENRISKWLKSDRTLSQSTIVKKLLADGVTVDRATVSRALKRMGWRRRKSYWQPPKTAKITQSSRSSNSVQSVYQDSTVFNSTQRSIQTRNNPELNGRKVIPFTPLLSPLRYPGGKRRLVSYVQELLVRNGLRPSLFIEPFAGGASVAIGVLALDLADRIALADRDELVADFWMTVFSKDASWLADQCRSVSLDLKTWRKMRAMTPNNRRERALKCLYLNRTSFSGIIERRAGPLGGHTQTITSIGCRFPREELARRIMALAEKRERVFFVRNQSYACTFADVKRLNLARTQPKDLFWYLDPPFFQKADRLYSYCFDLKDHEALARHIDDLPGHWLLSYDDDPEARRIYGHRRELQFAEIVYSTRRSDNRVANRRLYAGREILVSNLNIPGIDVNAKHSRRIRLAVLDGSQSAFGEESEQFGEHCEISTKLSPPIHKSTKLVNAR